MKFDRLVAIFSSMLLTIFVWLTMATSVRKGLPLLDASIFEYFGYAMSHGQKMYLDLFDHKGPVIFLINYIGYVLGGPLGIKFLYLSCIAVFFYISYFISRMFTNWKSSIVTLAILFIIFVSFFEGGWGLEGYVLPFLTYSLYIFLKFFLQGKVKNIEIVLTGVSFAVVLFTKANMIGIWLAFALVILFQSIYQKQFLYLANIVVFFLLGVSLFVVPLCIYLQVQGSLGEMFYQSVIMNFIYSKESSQLTIREVLLWYMEKANALQINFMILISSIVAWKRYSSKILIYHLIFLSCLFLSLVSKRPYLHYLLVIIPLMIPYISLTLDKFVQKNIFKYFAISIVGLGVIYYGEFQSIKSQINNRYGDVSVHEKEVANYIRDHSDKNDRIYSHRLNGIIYLYSERLSSTKFFFVPSLKDETPIIESFKESFETNPPKYIVFDSKWDYGRLTDSFIKEFIQKNYHEDKQIDTMKIYQKN